MDYNEISKVVREMGGRLSYSLEGFTHEFKVSFNYDGKFNQFKTSSMKESLAIKNIESYLKEMYPIQFQNALNQLNLK